MKMVVLFILLFFAIILPAPMFAENVVIENQVRAESDTGGNTVDGQEALNTANASASASVETIVNGETIVNINKHVESSTDSSSAEVSTETKTSGNATEVNTSVKINGEEVEEVNETAQNSEDVSESAQEQKETSVETPQKFFITALVNTWHAATEAINSFFSKIKSLFP